MQTLMMAEITPEATRSDEAGKENVLVANTSDDSPGVQPTGPSTQVSTKRQTLSDLFTIVSSPKFLHDSSPSRRLGALDPCKFIGPSQELSKCLGILGISEHPTFLTATN